MQGLRPFAAHQDENSTALFNRPVNGKSALGGEPSATPLGGMPSARKALGNITNRGFEENGPAGKTPGPGLTARKALGNIPGGNSVAKPKRSEAPAVAPAAAAPADRLQALVDGGVERMSGKGWQELEHDREARADEEIAQRLEAFAATARRGLPSYYPLWNAAAAGVLEREAVPSLPASPPSWPSAHSKGDEMVLCDELEDYRSALPPGGVLDEDALLADD